MVERASLSCPDGRLAASMRPRSRTDIIDDVIVLAPPSRLSCAPHHRHLRPPLPMLPRSRTAIAAASRTPSPPAPRWLCLSLSPRARSRSRSRRTRGLELGLEPRLARLVRRAPGHGLRGGWLAGHDQFRCGGLVWCVVLCDFYGGSAVSVICSRLTRISLRVSACVLAPVAVELLRRGALRCQGLRRRWRGDARGEPRPVTCAVFTCLPNGWHPVYSG